MIGDFRRSEQSDSRTIRVRMFWSEERQRFGRIELPPRLKSRLDALDYPALDEDMRLEAALSYAIFIAMRMGMSINLAGDASVWNPDWGRLEDTDRALPSDIQLSAALN